MALKFWNGHQWRRISKGEARHRRAQGHEVVDDEAMLAVVVLPLLTVSSPPPPEVAPSARLALVPAASAPVASPTIASASAPVVTDSIAEMSEAELEKLTAPAPLSASAMLDTSKHKHAPHHDKGK